MNMLCSCCFCAIHLLRASVCERQAGTSGLTSAVSSIDICNCEIATPGNHMNTHIMRETDREKEIACKCWSETQ